MILQINGWEFEIDREATAAHTGKNSEDHCDCGYCRNYYDTVAATYPALCAFLEELGVIYQGPSELLPYEPVLLLACYRVKGRITQWSRDDIIIDRIRIIPETADQESFFLWVGEMALPWVQEEDPNEVISPANLPEFLERMESIWLLRHGLENSFS